MRIERTVLPVREKSSSAVNRRGARMLPRLDNVMRKRSCYIAGLTNLSHWHTPSGIWAMFIVNKDARIWRSLVTTKHLDFIEPMKKVRLWI